MIREIDVIIVNIRVRRHVKYGLESQGPKKNPKTATLCAIKYCSMSSCTLNEKKIVKGHGNDLKTLRQL